MRSTISLTCLTLLLATSGAAAAQSRSPFETMIGFELITIGIETAAADSAGVGSRAWGFQMPASVTAFRVLTLNADGGLLFLSDEQAFTQETNVGERTSGVSAGTLALSAGLRTPTLSLGGEQPLFVSAGVNAGRNFVNVERSIAQCVDCHSEDVRVRAGNYWEGVLHVAPRSGTISARYRKYSGDSNFRDALMIGYSTPLRRLTRTPETPPTEPSP
ncbi:MAG TPA: hypothetical protein VF584_15200 [Longimicrobium sp.]|jgi:hypothetical protein